MNYMLWGLETPLTILLSVISMIVVIWAQSKVSGAYRKYRIIQNEKKMSGAEVARVILDANGLENIYIVETKGKLTDHYDPTRKVIRLSSAVFHGETIVAMSVAAHEVGHAIQDKEGYRMMRIRSSLVPFVNLVSYLGYFGIIISLFAGLTGYLMVSIVILLATLLFQLVTLPVEFDASKRAEKQLEILELATNEELPQSHDMLSAAAMTYVASLLSNILNLLRLVIMAQDRD